MNIIFRECYKCHGYGILDSGKYCPACGGKGRSGNGTIGSGELMFDKETSRQISLKELIKARAQVTTRPE